MPIEQSEIVEYLSGGSGNTSATASLGGARSSTVATQALFDAVTASEAAAGRVEYRCVYVRNEDPALSLDDVVVSVLSDTTSTSTSIAVGVGTSPINGTEQQIGSETTPPAGVTFGSSASLGSIPALSHRAYWERRSVNAVTQPLQADNSIIRVSGSYTEAT